MLIKIKIKEMLRKKKIFLQMQNALKIIKIKIIIKKLKFLKKENQIKINFYLNKKKKYLLIKIMIII